MDDQRIRAAVAFLDQEVPREEARVRLHQYGGGPDEGQITGNKTGYLRLGIEFLKAAYVDASNQPGSEGLPVDIDYLVTGDSSINFDWFERREFPIEEQTTTALSRFVGIPVAVLFAAIVVFAAIGFITVISSIGGD